MDLRYKRLLGIEVLHDYWQPGQFMNYEIRPSAGTGIALQNCRLVAKQVEDSFLLFYDSAIENKLKGWLLELQSPLEFELHLRDSQFLNYTDLQVEDISSTMVLLKSGRADGRLTVEEYLSEKDIASEIPTHQKDNWNRPFATIILRSEDLSNSVASEKTLVVKFKSRKVYVDYVIASSHLNSYPSLGISTRSGDKVEFLKNSEINYELPEPSTVLSSSEPLVLQNTPIQRFSLLREFDISSGKGKILMDTLPAPNSRGLQVLGKNEKTTYRVPIFVY